jgi:hypothetical protein
VGTYLHGPVLARNPALADQLLSWALGDLVPLPDLDIEVVDRLHDDRLAVAAGERRFTDQVDRPDGSGAARGLGSTLSARARAQIDAAVSEARRRRRSRGASPGSS